MKKEALYSRIEAFICEFPFLSRYDKIKIRRFSEKPKVQRVDLDLLDRSGWTEKASGYGVSGDMCFFLIDANGEELAKVKQSDVIRPKFSLLRVGTWLSRSIKGETVFEAIKKLDYPSRVRYVLEIRDLFGFRSQDSDPNFGLEVILHKVPARCSFSDWIFQIQEIATKELRGEIDNVDQV